MFNITFLISFTLHELSVRHSASHFPPNSEGVRCLVADLKPALTFDTRAKKIKIINISFSRMEIEPTTRRDYSHTFFISYLDNFSLNI